MICNFYKFYCDLLDQPQSRQLRHFVTFISRLVKNSDVQLWLVSCNILLFLINNRDLLSTFHINLFFESNIKYKWSWIAHLKRQLLNNASNQIMNFPQCDEYVSACIFSCVIYRILCNHCLEGFLYFTWTCN